MLGCTALESGRTARAVVDGLAMTQKCARCMQLACSAGVDMDRVKAHMDRVKAHMDRVKAPNFYSKGEGGQGMTAH